jgi:hypothetical protein
MTPLIPLRREPVDTAELTSLRDRGTLALDEQRRRPLYFDGRFLAARDLTREQTYFLSRQATLGQALGSGVVSGLMVTPGAGAGAVRIAAGLGLTPTGEMVAVDPAGDSLEVQLADVTVSEGLNAAFGLRRLPQPPARARTGLYVLGLRPVEFTANPIAAYPTSLDGPRSVQDGEIVEATAVTLVPYREGTGEVGMRRAQVARDLFVAGSTRGIPAEILPLALLALERGIVQWIDPFLVRRELGAQHGDLAGLGLSPRALREAYLTQYESHLRDVLADRKARGLSETFAATEHFLALPPAGRLPKGAVDATTFTQTFFPPEVDVDLAMVPEDEVPALFRDSLLLPPIDLTAGPEGLASTPVLALVPVTRDKLRELSGKLDQLTRSTSSLLSARIARQSPITLLQGIKLARLAIPAAAPAADPVDEAWRQALAAATSLWFVRRRNLSQRLERRAVNLVAVKPASGPLLGPVALPIPVASPAKNVLSAPAAAASAAPQAAAGVEKAPAADPQSEPQPADGGAGSPAGKATKRRVRAAGADPGKAEEP